MHFVLFLTFNLVSGDSLKRSKSIHDILTLNTNLKYQHQHTHQQQQHLNSHYYQQNDACIQTVGLEEPDNASLRHINGKLQITKSLHMSQQQRFASGNAGSANTSMNYPNNNLNQSIYSDHSTMSFQQQHMYAEDNDYGRRNDEQRRISQNRLSGSAGGGLICEANTNKYQLSTSSSNSSFCNSSSRKQQQLPPPLLDFSFKTTKPANKKPAYYDQHFLPPQPQYNHHHTNTTNNHHNHHHQAKYPVEDSYQMDPQTDLGNAKKANFYCEFKIFKVCLISSKLNKFRIMYLTFSKNSQIWLQSLPVYL